MDACEICGDYLGEEEPLVRRGGSWNHESCVRWQANEPGR